MTFFPGPDGKPLSGKRIADVLREKFLAIGLGPKIVDKSGTPKGLSGHSLRKRMATRLAQQCGRSELEIAAVLGDRDLRQARIYTAAASKTRLRENALFALLRLDAEEQPGTVGSHMPPTVSHTASQPIGNKGK
jgi:integrase